MGLFIGATVAPATPASAQDNITGRVVAEICLPYASRALSFEKAIRAARDMKFRRPADERGQPLEEYASEVNLVSRDGAWRIRLEEGTDENDERTPYYVSCALSSTRASATELADLGRRAFRDDRYWTMDETTPRVWDRRERRPEERRLEARVVEANGQRPALTIRGLYY
ncbi:MAG: hypothetical protein EON47_12300 [Acetobacteraceae bacterium]|nr:MAG: hypothetical protein EON47_12300 [Acetobacteraceae bacterium]